MRIELSITKGQGYGEKATVLLISDDGKVEQEFSAWSNNAVENVKKLIEENKK
jgi:hypothetical protein